MTRYYDEAPLDEYGRQTPRKLRSGFLVIALTSVLHADPGMEKEPKWGHLKDLHHALKLCRKGLLWGTPSVQAFEPGFEVRRRSNTVSIQFKRSPSKMR